MARRDDSLDAKIAAAAWEDFSQNGFSGASLRRIAEKAGVTIGAIRTRFPSKDDLFQSLVQTFLDALENAFQNVKADYYAETPMDLTAQLEGSMRRESQTILRLLFDHYDEARLVFFQSAGSRLEHCFDALVQKKIDESKAFFRCHEGAWIDEELLSLLIYTQFDGYRRLLLLCRDRQSAEKAMNVMMTYHLGGWTALFRSLDDEQ